MGVKLAAASGGSIELVPTDTASTFTATIPARTGNMMVDGPAFRVYLGSDQTVTSGTNTKVTLNTEVFDTANAFDSTTNYRFTPQVAGYYQFNVIQTATSSAALTFNWMQVRKNGSSDSIAIYAPYTGTGSIGSIATLIYLNGSTDYIELYANLSGAGTLTVNGGATSISTYMSGYLARSA